MKKYALEVLSDVLFSSKYICEQVFSNMSIIKSKPRAHLAGDSLHLALLKGCRPSPLSIEST